MRSIGIVSVGLIAALSGCGNVVSYRPPADGGTSDAGPLVDLAPVSTDLGVAPARRGPCRRAPRRRRGAPDR
ncbi:MAG: hypothetical protein IPF99_02735 [Deltaproteobacteria bacterium]|nr:hypothetical protein [Deltaproteobacteria bacterium]